MKSHNTTSHIPKRGWLASAVIALLFGSALAVASQAQAGVFVSVNFAPPLLPVYEQPAIPGPGYIWVPGYWAYDADDGYYWVPGTWVRPPYVGALWTPGYWAYDNDDYVFYPGYWGLNVGYYGGIDYGFGYTGVGYYGGYWNNGVFFYNTAFNRFGGVNITNVYNRTVIDNYTVNRFSYNGPGGVQRQPTPQEIANSRERRTGPVSAQVTQQTMAMHALSQRATVNHGAPPIAVTPRAGAFDKAAMTSTNTVKTESSRSAPQQARQGRETRTGVATATSERTSINTGRQSAAGRSRARAHLTATTRPTHAARTMHSTRTRSATVARQQHEHVARVASHGSHSVRTRQASMARSLHNRQASVTRSVRTRQRAAVEQPMNRRQSATVERPISARQRASIESRVQARQEPVARSNSSTSMRDTARATSHVSQNENAFRPSMQQRAERPRVYATRSGAPRPRFDSARTAPRQVAPAPRNNERRPAANGNTRPRDNSHGG